jgi:rare lipoprotein A
MLWLVRRTLAVVCLAALAAACSSAPPELSSVSLPPNAGIYKIGEPYQENGVWYYPREQPGYDETGLASWYGPTFHGRRTANGELFDSNGLTAAHRTLPMPVNVRVTNLENGRSLVVRVNDRGPFAHGRIIDVSERAAQLLGFYGKGTAKVRVTYLSRADLPGSSPVVTPPAIATAAAAAPTTPVQTASLDPVGGTQLPTDAPPPEQTTPTQPANTPVEQPPQLPPQDEPTGQVTQVAVPAVTHLYVQAGAFLQRSNAERLVTRLAAAGGVMISPIDRGNHRLYRVRTGPFDDVTAADAALARLTALGSEDAKIVVDR